MPAPDTGSGRAPLSPFATAIARAIQSASVPDSTPSLRAATQKAAQALTSWAALIAREHREQACLLLNGGTPERSDIIDRLETIATRSASLATTICIDLHSHLLTRARPGYPQGGDLAANTSPHV